MILTFFTSGILDVLNSVVIIPVAVHSLILVVYTLFYM